MNGDNERSTPEEAKIAQGLPALLRWLLAYPLLSVRWGASLTLVSIFSGFLIGLTLAELCKDCQPHL